MLAREVREETPYPFFLRLIRHDQGARLRQQSEKTAATNGEAEEDGEEVGGSDDDEDDDSDDEIDEEMGYISPLDTVDPYVTFKQALGSMFFLFFQNIF